MPNWCTNSFTVSHENPEMVAKFAKAVRDGNLFETFCPMPEGRDWYSWNIENWGTKWDISAGDVTVDEGNTSCSGWFETAWSPGIYAYDKLVEAGFELEVLYHEPGMCFAGRYDNGEEYYYEYDFTKENWQEDIDDDEVLALLESEYESWREWNEESEAQDEA